MLQQEGFFHWLVNKVSPTEMTDFFIVTPALNVYGVEKHLCNKSIFELTCISLAMCHFIEV